MKTVAVMAVFGLAAVYGGYEGVVKPALSSFNANMSGCGSLLSDCVQDDKPVHQFGQAPIFRFNQ